MEQYSVTDEELQETILRSYNEIKQHNSEIECSLCNDKGIVAVAVDEFYNVVMAPCECVTILKENGCTVFLTKKEAIKQSMEKLKESGLSKTIDKYTFDTYKTIYLWQEHVKQKAVKFINEKIKWFFIGGKSGSGKTHICTAICGILIKTKSVYYMSWRNEAVKLKANVNNSDVYDPIMKKITEVEILYIDDFFKSGIPNPKGISVYERFGITAADVNLAYQILDYRDKNNLTTIISSERTLNELLEVDEALVSRVIEQCGDYNIILSGSNMNMRLQSKGVIAG